MTCQIKEARLTLPGVQKRLELYRGEHLKLFVTQYKRHPLATDPLEMVLRRGKRRYQQAISTRFYNLNEANVIRQEITERVERITWYIAHQHLLWVAKHQ